MKLMVVDGNSILNRAFYGIRLLTAPDGTPTNAIYGFLNILNKYLTEQKPDGVCVCFDVSRKTFRNEIAESYKANRKGMPDELRVQLPIAKELLCALGYHVLGLEGFEADDLIGTLARAAEKQGNECVIVTGDRDSLQLVTDKVTVLLPSTKAGKTETTVFDPQTVLEVMGVRPDQIVDLKALMGDSSDNISGVAGIGSKTAVELIHDFESLENLYENLENAELKPAVLNKLQNGKDDAFTSQKLARINTAAPIETDSQSFKTGAVDKAAAAALLMRLNLKTFMEKYALTASDAVEIAAEVSESESREYNFKVVRVSKAAEMKGGDAVYLLCGGIVYATVEDSLYICYDVKGFLESERKKSTFDAKEQYLYALKNGIELKNVCFDLKLAAYLLEPTASKYEFDDLILKYGDVKATTDYVLEFGESEEAVLNAAKLPELCRVLSKKLEEQNMTSLLCEVEIPLSQTLSNMEFEGFKVDAEGIIAFDKELAASLEALRAKIYESAGCEFNLNSPKQLGEVLFEKLLLPVRKKTKTGYSTNAEVLESLKKEHPIVCDILEYRKVSKLKSTYTEGLLSKIAPDGRIHTTFLQTETRTGRLSSIEPNLQNIPVRTPLGARLREYFVADEGNVLVDADYSQIELRVLAHAAGDSAMIEAFNSGVDIHTATAAKIHNLPIDMVSSEVRQSAKAVNFGIVYGIGAFSLSNDIGTSVKEAQRLIDSYLTEFSGVCEYMKNTVSQGEQNGFVETLFGRRREIPELKSSNKMLHAAGERVARNTPIQGTAADIIKIAMNRVYSRLKSELPDARLILQVHDELIVECKAADGEKAAAIVKEEMQKSAELKVRLEADVHIGKNWLEAK